MKKRILSILLALCMVMCAISPVMSYADPGVSASGSSAYGALLTPDTTPPVGWAEDESQPVRHQERSALCYHPMV